MEPGGGEAEPVGAGGSASSGLLPNSVGGGIIEVGPKAMFRDGPVRGAMNACRKFCRDAAFRLRLPNRVLAYSCRPAKLGFRANDNDRCLDQR